LVSRLFGDLAGSWPTLELDAIESRSWTAYRASDEQMRVITWSHQSLGDSIVLFPVVSFTSPQILIAKPTFA
jgi:hypothetical protein